MLTAIVHCVIIPTYRQTTASKYKQEDNDMKIFFEAKPVLAIAIVTAIEEMVEKDEGVFSPDELNELERIAKSIERQVHETN